AVLSECSPAGRPDPAAPARGTARLAGRARRTPWNRAFTAPERTGSAVSWRSDGAIAGSGDDRGVHPGPELRLCRGEPAVPHRRRLGGRGGAGHHVPPAAERHVLRRPVGPDPAG